eukprot:c20240_g2_i1 orf=258-437(+)
MKTISLSLPGGLLSLYYFAMGRVIDRLQNGIHIASCNYFHLLTYFNITESCFPISTRFP